MPGLVGPISTPAAVGGLGVATATVQTSQLIVGELCGVYIQYNDAPPVTTDVTIRTVGQTGVLPAHTIMVLSNANANLYTAPRVQARDVAGALIAGEYVPVMVNDFLQIDLAQANAGDSVTLWFFMA